MITQLRRSSKRPIFLGILALIAIAFVITGINAPGSTGLGSGLGAQSLASVDGVDVTVAEVTDQAQRQLEAARQQDPTADIGKLVAAGGIEQVIDGLLSQRAVRAFADDIGMRVSKALVDGQIASLDAFKDLRGKFSQDIYNAKLKGQRITDQQLRDDLYATTIQRQILIPAGAGSRVPLGVAQPYAAMLLESRTGLVGIVPTADIARVTEPNEAQLAAFYQQNRARYVIPERRVVRYALIGPEQSVTPPPTDAEIAADYRANAATYAGKETRVLSQVVLSTEATARALAARVAGGQTFVAAAAADGFGAGDISLGPQDKAAFARLTSDAVANTVFGAAEGAVAGPLQSPLGWHVVRVDEVRRTQGRPLAAVRNEIATRLGAEKSANALTDLVGQIEEQIADGSSLADVAAARKLAVVTTPPITSAGAAPGQPAYRPGPELQPLLANAFAAAPDEDPTVDAIPGTNRYAIVAVDRIVPAAPPPLAAVITDVREDYKGKLAFDAARATATEIVRKVNGGTPISRAFADAGVRLGAPRPVTARRLDVARANREIPPPIQMLFSLPEGRARLLAAPGNAGFFVVHLTDIVPGDAGTSPGLIEATRAQFSQAAGQEYVEQFVGAVRGGKKIVRDQAAITRLKKQLDGTVSATR